VKSRKSIIAAAAAVALGTTGLSALPALASAHHPGAAASAVTRPPFIGIGADGTTRTSENWSGYAATGSAYTSVSADWTQPAGTCSSGDTYAGFWVGLDGYTSRSVEQTGTETDCIGGTPQYGAWYEMYPAASVSFSNPVAAGDHFTASVTASGDTFTLKISDLTAGWTHTVTKTSAVAKKSSAEVIAEAPCCTVGGGILPLTNFGTVRFTDSMVDGGAAGRHPRRQDQHAAGR
jgi:hypothetical protein